jgi:RNA polymerase sigma-70 factor (ECF subfamily)
VEGRPLEGRENSAEDAREDATLVGQAKEGDVRAYEELMGRYENAAFRTAYLITRNGADAEDAAQDAFVKAYYALHRFREDAPFRPWMLRIVANEARNRRRSARRREGLVLRLRASQAGGADEVRPSGGAAPSPEEAAVARDRREILLGALEEMREEDRLVIAYRYFLDLSEADTARALGIRPGTVKSRLSRALGRLRERLAEQAHATGVEEAMNDG